MSTISLKIHPDKLVGLEEGYEKNKKLELYQVAREALAENDMIMMADVALELGLNIPKISPERLKKAEKEIIAIKKELSFIESTIVWHWFFTECEIRKEQILEDLFTKMYEQRKNNNLGT